MGRCVHDLVYRTVDLVVFGSVLVFGWVLIFPPERKVAGLRKSIHRLSVQKMAFRQQGQIRQFERRFGECFEEGYCRYLFD